MKLRSSLHPQQLLFLFLCIALFSLLGNARAQQDAYVTFKASPQQEVPMKVVGVSGSSLMVREQFGDKGIPLSQIQNVRMNKPPPEVEAAQAAFRAKDFAKALATVRTVNDKFKGLPSSWAVTALSLVGDIYLEQGDLAKAAAAYDDFAKAYPGNGSADLGRARIAVAKKDYDTAKKTAEPLCEQALKEKNVPQGQGQIYGQAFLVLGQVKEAQGDYQGALKEYLRTVTLFYHDTTATALAQERADALRKAHAAFVP